MLSKRTELINKLATSIQAYSPIIVEGDDGAGKSCFLRALCERLDELGVISDYTIRHAWDVENALLDSLCNGSSQPWRSELLDSSLIVIDDFQYLEWKPTTSEALCQVFRSAHVPIIVATSRPIGKSHMAGADLNRFFSAGTRVYLDKPTPEEVTDCLRQQLRENVLSLTEDAWAWLMSQRITEPATVKGIIKTLLLYRAASEELVDLGSCQRLIEPILSSEKK